MTTAKELLAELGEGRSEHQDSNYRNLERQVRMMAKMKPDEKPKQKESQFGSLLLMVKAAMKGEELHAQAGWLDDVIKKLK